MNAGSGSEVNLANYLLIFFFFSWNLEFHTMFVVSLNAGYTSYVVHLLIFELFRNFQSKSNESVSLVCFFQNRPHDSEISRNSLNRDHSYLNPLQKGLPRALNYQKIRFCSDIPGWKENFYLTVLVPLSSVQKHSQNGFFSQFFGEGKLPNLLHHVVSILTL